MTNNLWARLKLLAGSKTAAANQRNDDPCTALDTSYTSQLAMLATLRAALIDVGTACTRLEHESQTHQEHAATLEHHARAALRYGRDDLARVALERRAEHVIAISAAAAQHSELVEENARLSAAVAAMTTQTQTFRTRKETTKAAYSAAQTHLEAATSVAGLDGQTPHILRAQERLTDMAARADAVGEVVAGEPAAHLLDEQLASLDIEATLERLKPRAGPRPITGPQTH